MMDHRKTNFPMGNQFLNTFSPGDQASRAQRAGLLDGKYRTIDVGYQNNGPSSPLARTFNLEFAQNPLLGASNHFVMTPQHGYRSKPGFDRPQTTIDASAATRLRRGGDYQKNKNEGETSKVQMGTEKRLRQPSASPIGGGAGATDYRNNFTWTVPKYA